MSSVKTNKYGIVSVGLEGEIVDRVRQHVKETKQTIGGCISLIVEKELDKADRRKSKKVPLK